MIKTFSTAALLLLLSPLARAAQNLDNILDLNARANGGADKYARERDYRAFHPAIDATRVTVETRHEGELWVDGVLRFRRSENSNVETGEWLGTSIVRSVEHNIELDEDYFRPPTSLSGGN